MRHEPTHQLTRHRRQRRRALAAAATLLVAAAGCGDSSEVAADPSAESTATETTPAGTSPAPSTSEPRTDTTEPGRLVVATTPGWESALEPLLAELAATGDDAISFELDGDWMDANAGEDVEQRILKAVASGELGAGYVGVRALSALGVPGFDVLVAPRLVDSYELQEAILDSDIPGRLLPMLDDIGVVGVALVPGPMRYLIGVEQPFSEPDDFTAATFHTFPSAINAATAEALGATHSQLWGGDRDEAIDDGTIDVTENSLEWMRNNGRGSHATLDPMWPAAGVFVVSSDVVDGWSASQLELATSVVVAASSSAADLVAADNAFVAELCGDGKQFVESSSDELAAMLDALRPVYDVLAVDPTAASLLDAIEALKTTVAATTPAIPDGCDGEVEETVALGTDDPSVLDGSYRIEWTADELMAELDFDQGTARGNDGVFVLTFDGGRFEGVWEDDPDAPCGGSYGVSGDRVRLVASRDPSTWTCGGDSLGELIVDAAWRVDGDQLVLSDFDVSSDLTWVFSAFMSKPFTRTAPP